jgi:hypothetical protein
VLRVVFHDQIDSLSPDVHQRVDAFLADYIPEATVQMSPTTYRGATMWALALDHDEQIIGFAAQRLFKEKSASIIQIMGTYLSPALRGQLMASTLLQGMIFFKTWLRSPFKPILWCTRTRVPAVYRTAARFNQIYPKLDAPEKNRTMWGLADRIARLVYGNHATLKPDTFVLENSYKPDSTFLQLRRKRATPVDDAFTRALNYDGNEAIFILCRLNRLNILRYILTNALFRVTNQLALATYRAYGWLRDRLWRPRGENGRRHRHNHV